MRGVRRGRGRFNDSHTFTLSGLRLSSPSCARGLRRLSPTLPTHFHTLHTSRLEAEQSKLRKGFEAKLATQQQLLLAAKNADVSNLLQKHAFEQVREGGVSGGGARVSFTYSAEACICSPSSL